MDKTVLISGGSGFLGINMVRHLLGQGGMKVRVLDIADFDYPEADRIGFIKGDIRDRETVARAMEGVQWVIHTAAALPLYKPADIFSTEVEGTRILLEAAHTAAATSRRGWLTSSGRPSRRFTTVCHSPTSISAACIVHHPANASPPTHRRWAAPCRTWRTPCRPGGGPPAWRHSHPG